MLNNNLVLQQSGFIQIEIFIETVASRYRIIPSI